MPQPLPRLHVELERREDEKKIAKLLLETGEPAPPTVGVTSGGDGARLRGLPAIGRGVTGAIPDTSPHGALVGKERQRRRHSHR